VRTPHLAPSSDKPITGVSTYNVVPDKAALYFNKIQCFCFEEQRLRPGEAVDMPVFFYIDPELADDFNCRCGAGRTAGRTGPDWTGRGVGGGGRVARGPTLVPPPSP
jgi:hypothetical protein